MTPTLTRNTRLAPRLGGFACLAEALDYAAGGETGINFYSSLGQLDQCLAYSELSQKARHAASHLHGLGLPRGAYLALVADSSVEFLSLFYACQYAGLVPCPLPFSVHPGGKDAYIDQLAGMLGASRAPLAISPQSVRECLEAAALCSGTRVLTHAELHALPAHPQPEPLGPGDMAYVQYSSGSTSQPKGVLISQRAVCSNVDAILRHGMAMRAGDRACSWLPFYHDMGLVGFSIAALCAQCSVDYLAPTTFAKRPSLWLQLMSANRSTITYAPGFGYRLAVQRLKDIDDLDLSALRVAGIGGDMIRPSVLAEFTEALAPCGFRAEAWSPSYGMAEATLAVAIGRSGQGPRLSRCLGADGRPRDLVACGLALPDTEVRVLDASGRPLPAGQAGHLWVRGPGLMSGYLRDARLDDSMFDAEGFFDSGDLGYMEDGQVVVTGRAKELILLRGRNLWPQDIEWALERVEPLGQGDVAAFAVEAGEDEELVVLVQSRLHGDAEHREGLRTRLATVLSQHFGVSAQLVFLPPRSLPMTTSGKLSRSRAKDFYLRGDYRAT